MPFWTDADRKQFIELLQQRPRPSVAELCKFVEVEPDGSSMHTYMPWIKVVRHHSRGNRLVRAMLTQLVLHGSRGVRNTFCVAFWREPMVHEVLDRASLMRLCRKWAARQPYEILQDYNDLAYALGRYARPDLEDREELIAAGAADAAKIVAVAARNLRDWLHPDHLALMHNCNLPTATLLKAALRVKHGIHALLFQGYVMAQPNLNRKDSELLTEHIMKQFAELKTYDPKYVTCAYRWLLRGITNATGSEQYQHVRGLSALRSWMKEHGWQFLTATESHTGVHVEVPRAGTLLHLPGVRDDVIRGGDMVMVHRTTELRHSTTRHPFHPCKPPSARKESSCLRSGDMTF